MEFAPAGCRDNQEYAALLDWYKSPITLEQANEFAGVLEASLELRSVTKTFGGAKRALEVLREFDGRRVVVTPGLVELGKREKEENEILGKEIANVANLALIIGRNGEYIRKGLIENGFPEENALFFKKLSDAERFFPDLFSPNDAVLFLNDLPDELN